MLIKKYTGNNVQEAILKVKMDLGKDAIIMSTRKVKQKGFFKLFSKPLFEVTAALDEKPKIIEKPIQEEKKDSIEKEKITNLENKITDMESLLRKIYVQISSDGKINVEKEEKKSRVSELFSNTLMKNDVDQEIINKIIEDVQNKFGNEPNMNDAANHIYNYISNLLGKAQPIQVAENAKQLKVIFIGPTGVGKTTTIAKLAADFVLNKKKSIGLITADTYRIAAVEQLKTYAEILNIPVKIIYSPTEIDAAVEQFKDKDVILIDTAGRSHRKKNQMDELKNVVTAANANEVYLVTSANTRVKDFKEIIDIYGFISDYKIIITKIDETNSVGNVLNIKYFSQKPLSYITTGQSVPDDIEVLNIDKITRCIMGSMRYDGSS